MFSVHAILQARILEWVAISSFRVSSPARDGTLRWQADSLPLSHLGSPILRIQNSVLLDIQASSLMKSRLDGIILREQNDIRAVSLHIFLIARKTDHCIELYFGNEAMVQLLETFG